MPSDTKNVEPGLSLYPFKRDYNIANKYNWKDW